jgi:cell division protease FtsH
LSHHHSKIKSSSLKDKESVIEDIKNEKNENEDALCAVHEAGHAVAYSVLFKTSPTQIICKTADDETGGFIGCHSISLTESKYKERIIVSLAGKAAEEFVFGKSNVSNGSISDIKHATSLASSYVRRIGFDVIKSYTCSTVMDPSSSLNQNMDITNELIENIIKESTHKVESIIKENSKYLKEVVAELFNKKELTPSEFIDISKKYIPEIKELHPKETIIDNYHKHMLNFLNN